MKIYFIRHGHAEHNLAFEKCGSIAYDSFDYLYSKLTTKGETQIKNININNIIQKVYCSPLKRCIETSRILFGYSRLLYLYDGLIETQGPYPCNYREPYEEFLYYKNKYNLENINEKYIPSKITESKTLLKERVINTYEAIKNDSIKNNLSYIAIVTHNDWLESLFGRPFSNGEVYIVDV